MVKTVALIATGFALGIVGAIALTTFIDTSAVTIGNQRNELQELRRQLSGTAEYRKPVAAVNATADANTDELKNGGHRDREIQQLTPQVSDLLQKNTELAEERDALRAKIQEATAETLQAKNAAKRAYEELNRLKDSLPAGNAEGHIPNTEFYFRNFQWSENGAYVDIIGEMQNRTGTNWEWAAFQIAAYDESNRLLAVSSFHIAEFYSGMVKAFQDTFIDAQNSPGMRVKITFEGGLEKKV